MSNCEITGSGASIRADGASMPDYVGADPDVRAFAAKIRECEVARDAPLPSYLDLEAPPACVLGVDNEFDKIYHDYTAARVSLDQARAWAASVCEQRNGVDVADPEAMSKASQGQTGGGTIVTNPYAPQPEAPPPPEWYEETPGKVGIGVGGVALLGLLYLAFRRKK